MCAVCHGLFVLHLGVIGMLCFVIVALPVIVYILHTVMLYSLPMFPSKLLLRT